MDNIQSNLGTSSGKKDNSLSKQHSQNKNNNPHPVHCSQFPTNRSTSTPTNTNPFPMIQSPHNPSTNIFPQVNQSHPPYQNSQVSPPSPAFSIPLGFSPPLTPVSSPDRHSQSARVCLPCVFACPRNLPASHPQHPNSHNFI